MALATGSHFHTFAPRTAPTGPARGLYGVKARQGSPRSPGQGGSGVGAVTPGTSGRIRRDGRLCERAIVTLALCRGTVSANAQTGWSPTGALTVTRIREPARYMCPW